MTAGNEGRPDGAEFIDMGDRRHIDRARAERLLAGTDTGDDVLGRLLAAARAPGQPAELRGEAAALGAFRIGATREPRGRVVARHHLWPRLVGVKVAAAALAVTAAGVAVAAGTGVLPDPHEKPAATGSATPAVAPEDPLTSYADRRSTQPPSPSIVDRSPSSGPSGTPSASANPSMLGLCKAYQAHGDREPGQSMDSTAFRQLVEAAGGEDRVAAYCTDLLAQPSAAASSPSPSSAPSPSSEQ